MRLFGLMITTFVLGLVSACSPVLIPQGNNLTSTTAAVTLKPPVAVPSVTVPALPTTPAPEMARTPTDLPYASCGWVWATQDLPEVNALLKQAFLDAGMPEVDASASAYGENCLDSAGKVNHFAAMETDFNLAVTVDDPKNTQILGEWVAKILPVVEKIPGDQLPGPNPGRISIRFTAGADQANLSFSRAKGVELLNQGLSGSALFEALKSGS